jgi:hypothetical protein
MKLLKALLVALDQSLDGCLGSGRDLVPQPFSKKIDFPWRILELSGLGE